MNLVPLTYVPLAPDTGLADALRADMPGILAWAVPGCLAWQPAALAPPAILRDATDSYFAAQERRFAKRKTKTGRVFVRLRLRPGHGFGQVATESQAV